MEVRDLSVHFGGRARWPRRPAPVTRAVDGVSLSVRRGEILGLVGESGCGKSTLARAILRLVRPASGTIRFDGADWSGLPEDRLRPLRRNLQVVFQDPYHALNPRKRVRDILSAGPRAHGLFADRADLARHLAEGMRKVGLPPQMLDRTPGDFSGGQRQRIAIARALSVGPKLVICDEPVSALDVSVQAQILNLLLDLRASEGLTLLFISHDLSVVRHVSDRVAVMRSGRIVEEGPADLLDRPEHPYTRMLVEASPKLDRAGPNLT